jgi:hypothetical protein
MRHRPTSQDRLTRLRGLAVVLGLSLLSAGCATTAGWFGATPEASRPGPVPSESVLAHADDLLRQGEPQVARDLYVLIASGPERDATHARAQFNLAKLYTDPSTGFRDYRLAQLAFERLLKEYPSGDWDRDALAWCTALDVLATREVELEARDGELHVREAELVRLKMEAARLGSDLQRLKKIDLNLERRR